MQIASDGATSLWGLDAIRVVRSIFSVREFSQLPHAALVLPFHLSYKNKKWKIKLEIPFIEGNVMHSVDNLNVSESLQNAKNHVGFINCRSDNKKQ
jgi:DUF2075 family protein